MATCDQNGHLYGHEGACMFCGAVPVNLVRNAKPEVSPMQDAESLSGVSTLGSSASPNLTADLGPESDDI